MPEDGKVYRYSIADNGVRDSFINGKINERYILEENGRLFFGSLNRIAMYCIVENINPESLDIKGYNNTIRNETIEMLKIIYKSHIDLLNSKFETQRP